MFYPSPVRVFVRNNNATWGVAMRKKQNACSFIKTKEAKTVAKKSRGKLKQDI